ncbi:MAG: hypothetical protein ACRD2P_03645 [Terriglobia bacterium]
MATLPPDTVGFVLANVTTSDFTIPPNGQFHITVTTADGGKDRYGCLTLAKQSPQSFSLFLFALALACLSLPATTALPLGEYPANSKQLLWTTRTRRWIFLLTKIALIVPIVYFVSIDLAYFSGSMNPVYSRYIQLGRPFRHFSSRFVGPCGISGSVARCAFVCLAIRPTSDNLREMFWPGMARNLSAFKDTGCCMFPIFQPVGSVRNAGYIWTLPGAAFFRMLNLRTL